MFDTAEIIGLALGAIVFVAMFPDGNLGVLLVIWAGIYAGVMWLPELPDLLGTAWDIITGPFTKDH